jgi:hypothetical protein
MLLLILADENNVSGNGCLHDTAGIPTFNQQQRLPAPAHKL